MRKFRGSCVVDLQRWGFLANFVSCKLMKLRHLIMTVDNFEIFTLPSGLRCVVRSFDGPSYCQLNINAGSRDDFADRQGLAHFVEHTVFRGTGKRSGWQINARAEDVGGGLNAYTSRELTAYYVITPTGQLSRGLELLADIVGNPSFPAAELEREKTIIYEEIKSDIDAPDEAIFDEMADLIFAGSQLGHNILGSCASVETISPDDAHRYVRNLYTPQNMVLSCVADMPVAKIRKQIERYMKVIAARETVQSRPQSPGIEPFEIERTKGLSQCHTIMASRIFDCYDPRRHALTLLRHHLGSGMNSLLYRELREKRGYVYTVDASSNLYTDAGSFSIYFGCAEGNEKRCRRLINRLLEKMAENPMKPGAFERLRRNFAGRTEILNSAINKRVSNAGRQLLRYDKILSRAEANDILHSITPEQMRECAEEILKPGLSVLTYK